MIAPRRVDEEGMQEPGKDSNGRGHALNGMRGVEGKWSAFSGGRNQN